MEAIELREGNYFKDQEGKEYQLNHLDFEDDRTDFCLVYGNALGGQYIWKEDSLPIQLTEDWLKKFGFEASKEKDKFFIRGNNFGVSVDGHRFRFVMGNFVCQLVIKELYYVHQLQNLYFAITNDELT